MLGDAGAQIIHNDDRLTSALQQPEDMGTDISRTTSHQNSHGSRLSPRTVCAARAEVASAL